MCNSSNLFQETAGNRPTYTTTTISRGITPSSLQILPSCEQQSRTGQRWWFWEVWFLDLEGDSGGTMLAADNPVHPPLKQLLQKGMGHRDLLRVTLNCVTWGRIESHPSHPQISAWLNEGKAVWTTSRACYMPYHTIIIIFFTNIYYQSS